MLQPFQYDPNEKNRHKFLVQTLIVPDEVTEIQESLVRKFIFVQVFAVQFCFICITVHFFQIKILWQHHLICCVINDFMLLQNENYFCLLKLELI